MKTYQEWCRSKAKAVWERARPRTQAEKGALVRRALLSPWRARLGCRLPRKLKGLASGAYVPLQYLRRSAAISPASPTPLRNHFAPLHGREWQARFRYDLPQLPASRPPDTRLSADAPRLRNEHNLMLG